MKMGCITMSVIGNLMMMLSGTFSTTQRNSLPEMAPSSVLTKPEDLKTSLVYNPLRNETYVMQSGIDGNTIINTLGSGK